MSSVNMLYSIDLGYMHTPSILKIQCLQAFQFKFSRNVLVITISMCSLISLKSPSNSTSLIVWGRIVYISRFRISPEMIDLCFGSHHYFSLVLFVYDM